MLNYYINLIKSRYFDFASNLSHFRDDTFLIELHFLMNTSIIYSSTSIASITTEIRKVSDLITLSLRSVADFNHRLFQRVAAARRSGYRLLYR